VFYTGAKLETLKDILNHKTRAIRLIANITGTASCKPYFKKLTILAVPCVCVCVCARTRVCAYVCACARAYAHVRVDEILLYTKMYLSRLSNSVFRPYDTWNKSDLFKS